MIPGETEGRGRGTSCAVITAVYGAYDVLKPAVPQEGGDVEWVCVTDDPASLGPDSEGWRIIRQPAPGVHPNRAAKIPKYFPWRYTRAGRSVWVDAAFRVTSRRFASEALAHVSRDRPVAQFVHPWRNCLYLEAQASEGIPKYTGEPVLAQAQEYRGLGHPPGWGLWATGCIARVHTYEVFTFANEWARQTDAWSFQDQVSQPFALRVSGLRPVSLPGTHFSNPWLTHEPSGLH